MRVTLVAIVTLGVLATHATAPRAETVDDAYKDGLQHYYAGRYKEAVAAFERVLAIPVHHEDLHYNLGCAYFRLGRLGPAIYHFERSLELDPEAEDAAFNLKTVRSMVASRVKDELKGASKEPWWARMASLMSQTGWATIFLVLWWLVFAILFALRYINPGPARAGLTAGNVFVGLLALLCGALLTGRIMLSEVVVRGIVLPDRMEVREGPNAQTKVTFKVHAGLKVRVQARMGGWVRIRLANGLEGWVEEREVGVL